MYLLSFAEWKVDQDIKKWSISQITIFLVGSFLLVGSSILFTVILATRKRYSRHNDEHTTTKRLKLPISSSDNTYTVAYQLKTGSKQPDIISRGMIRIVINAQLIVTWEKY